MNIARTVLLAVLMLVLHSAASLGETVVRETSVRVCFTPGEPCGRAIVVEMDGAKREILIQAYGFTSKDLAAAAMRAVKRGVRVRAILDKSNRSDRYSAATFLAHAGAEVSIDARHAIAHNKIMVIDGETVVTGSYNFTRAAEERNAENVLIVRSKRLAEAYAENWRKHAGHSEEYAGR